MSMIFSHYTANKFWYESQQLFCFSKSKSKHTHISQIWYRQSGELEHRFVVIQCQSRGRKYFRLLLLWKPAGWKEPWKWNPNKCVLSCNLSNSNSSCSPTPTKLGGCVKLDIHCTIFEILLFNSSSYCQSTWSVMHSQSPRFMCSHYMVWSSSHNLGAHTEHSKQKIKEPVSSWALFQLLPIAYKA